MTANEIRVEVEGLGKEYLRRAAVARTWRELFGSAARPRGAAEPFWALRGVSFSVGAGEMLGIVGGNGAGKSTLLRLLGGIGRPTAGRLNVRGRIGALLELGGSFLGDLSGRENAVLAAVVAGYTQAEAHARIDEIVAFAELEAVIDTPLRTYSSGMMMRLAFSVAVHTEPDVLLVDEFLSVGDLAFQAKCLARIRRIREDGCAVILVSHGMDQVRRSCERALWLRRGEVVAHDAAEVVAGAYEAEMRAETLRRTPPAPPRALTDGQTLRVGENRFGSFDVEIVGVGLRPAGALHSGGSLSVDIRWKAARPAPGPIFTVTIRRDDGTICLDTNTQASGDAAPDLLGEGTVRLEFDRLEIGAGSYYVDVGIYERNWSHAYDYHWHVYPLVVDGPNALKGVMVPPSRWTIAGLP